MNPKTQKDTPAFPSEDGPNTDKGMTLRDYFAAKAMQGYLYSHVQCAATPPLCAEWAYQLADAMLAERNK